MFTQLLKALHIVATCKATCYFVTGHMNPYSARTAVNLATNSVKVTQ